MAERQTSPAIDAQAAEWAARVDGGPLSDGEQAALDAWLGADVRRVGAYAKARAVFAHVQRARALGPDYDAAEFAQPEPPARPGLSRRRMWMGGAAAAAGVVAAAGVGLQVGLPGHYRTRRGEVRLVPLPDGSSMTLNTASRAVIEFTGTERRVRLVEGEALFDVAKDPARPFLVAAADTQVRAVGTSFVVRCLARAPVQVLVREGVVEVKRRAAPEAATPVRLPANMRAVASTGGAVATSNVTAAEVQRELVWREGLLSFEDMPLDQAVTEFARYSATPIVIDDPALARETVTGLFRANNPGGFARAVADALDVRAEVTSREVRLYR